MCASTGLRHGGFAVGVDGEPFSPLDDRETASEVAAWWAEQNGQMKITGKHARNLNPIIRSRNDHGDNGGAANRELVFAWWWIWRNSSGPVKFSAFNSRSDRLLQSWPREFQRRAIIPASWYVEKGVRFEHPTGNAFGIAAVTSTVTEPDGNELVTYSLVTRASVGEAASVHDRMPLVLPPERHGEWLDSERPGDKDLATAAVFWSDEISLEINSTSNPTALPNPTTPPKRPALPNTPTLF